MQVGFTGIIPGKDIVINDRTTGAIVPISWKERLFSWPWRPWVKERFDPLAGEMCIPDGQIIQVNNGHTLYVNSRTFHDLKHRLGKPS